MKMRKSILRIILCLALIFAMFFRGSLKASAINTVFMVPPINGDYIHHNTVYLSPNYNISVIVNGQGTSADVLNTTGDLGAILAELNANVTPTGDYRGMAIYMEGVGLSDADVAAILGGGWNRTELYYDTYFVSCTPNGAMHPNIQLVNDDKIGSVLAQAGFENEFAVIEVTGVNSSWAYLIKYDPALEFLHGTSVRVYKYLPDLAVFLEVEEVYFDSYNRNFLEWDNPQLVDPQIDGLYVAVGRELPDGVVCTPDEVVDLRANLPIISNTEGNVHWTMAPGLIPDNFTAEAVVTPVNETEVSVEFVYSGELPEGTEVTVEIPLKVIGFTEGMELYLYYCNLETQLREFVSSGTYADQRVTFAIYHCSAYVITATDHGESYMPEPEEEEPSGTEATTIPEETGAEHETAPTEILPAPQPEKNSPMWILLAVVVAVAMVSMMIIRRKKK